LKPAQSQSRYFAIETWGCQMNVHDSEKMAGALGQLGYRQTSDLRRADLILLNTCAIREKATHKVYGRLGRLRRLKTRNPDLLIGVAGCVAQLEGEKMFQRAPFVDLILGPRGLAALPDLLQTARVRRAAHLIPKQDSLTYPFEAAVRTGQAKAFITVMEGCNKRCTYCIVPRTRGLEESRPLAHVLQEVRFLVEKGYKEFELLGQNVNTYRHGDEDFAGLLRAVDAVVGVERIRFTTSHPLHFENSIIEAMAEAEHVCPSVHLPVQSGSTRVLRQMRRGYSREGYLERVRRLRELVPGCALSTDIIVGFPGETEPEFEETLSLLEEVRFEKVYSFLFSPRPGTTAERMEDTVPLERKREWLARLQGRQQVIREENHSAMEGRTVEVLVEGRARSGDGVYAGRTPHNDLVHFAGHDGMVGRILPIQIDSSSPNALYGDLRTDMALVGFP
jgi:tRNA-2-methylthio-N6-dimethylallyladenosine synthase